VRTFKSTNPIESLNDGIRTMQRNVKNWKSRQDGGALEVSSQVVRAGGLQRHGADDPRDPEAHARGAAPLRTGRRSSARPGSLRTERARTPRPSKPLARTPPASSAPTRPNTAEYCECEPLGSSSGPIRVPRNAPSANPASRQRADDEALQIAVEGEQNGEGDDQPVDRCHLQQVICAPEVRCIFYRSALG